MLKILLKRKTKQKIKYILVNVQEWHFRTDKQQKLEEERHSGEVIKGGDLLSYQTQSNFLF